MKLPLHLTIAFLFISIFILNAQQADTTAVRDLHKKGTSFWSTYPDSLLLYRDSSYRLAVTINDEIGIGDSFTDLGIYHWVKGNYSEAIHAYDTANQIFEKINRDDRKMGNLSNLGMVYSRLGDFSKAINFLLASLRIAEKLNKKDGQAKVYNSLGVAYKNQNNIEDAFEAYTKALALFKETNNKESVAGCYTNIGNIYLIKSDYDKALEFQLKSVTLFDSLKNYRGLVTCYNNTSDIYLLKQKHKDALDYRLHALTLSRDKGFFTSEVVALLGLGSIYTSLKDFKKAENYFLEGLALAKKKNYRSEVVNLYQGISNCYKGIGRNDLALHYHELYSSLKDSLYTQQSLTSISNLRTAYELEKKEASIELLKKDNQIATLSRNRTIIISIALLLVAALIVGWQRFKIRKDAQLMGQQKQLHQTQQALNAIELHNAKHKEEELLKEIAYKNKSLTTYALSMVQKNEVLEEVKESIELLLKKPDNQAEHFKKLSRIIDYGFTLDKDWEDFKLYFEEVHTDFFLKLRDRFPDLGGADLKLCALIRLSLNMKQAAAILRISPDSVKVARYRLRKKFNLQTEDNLTGFIMLL
jgi:tetratricopeptide (TPR) repeat protein